MSGVVVGVLVGVVVLALTAVVVWLYRTSTLTHRVGSFRCSLGKSVDGPWAAGYGQYGAHRLYWWRRWSLSPRPRVRWDRADFTVIARDGRTASHGPLLVVTCRSGGREVYLRMSPDAYHGLTSWIEATPSRVGSVI